MSTTTNTAAKAARKPRTDLRVLLLATACTLSAGAARAEVSFVPRIGVAGIYSDNIEIAPEGAEESEFVGLLAPGFTFEADTARFDARTAYEMQSLFFTDDSDRDSTFHEFDGRATLDVLRDALAVDATAQYTQQIVDPAREIPFSNVVPASGNRTDAATYRVNPYFQHRFGSAARVRVDYAHGGVQYSRDADILTDDLTQQEAGLLIASVQNDTRLGWELSYDRDEVDYDLTPDAVFETAAAELEYRATPQFALLARGGLETDLESDLTDGNLDADFWEGGFRYAPGPRTSVEAAVGERFFGTAYRARAAFEGRAVRLAASYDESPDTSGRAQLRVPFVLDPSPVLGGAPIVRITPEIYLGKSFAGDLVWAIGRSEFQLTAFSERREYLGTQDVDQNRGAASEFRWRMGPRTTLRVSADWERIAYRATERSDDLYIAALGIERRVGPRSRASLSFQHSGRNTDDAAAALFEYEENAVTLDFRYDFGRGAGRREERGR